MAVSMDVAPMAIAPAKKKPREWHKAPVAHEAAFILGGTAQSSYDLLFEVLVEELVEFKMVFGHCLVPAEYAENPTLARWVVVQRAQHFQGHIKASHAERLESIGFSWNPPLVPQKVVLVAPNSITTVVDPTASLVPANERQEMRERKQMRSILSAVFLKKLEPTKKTPNEESVPDLTKSSQEEIVESNETEAPLAESNETRVDESMKEIVSRVVNSGLEEPNQKARNLELAESNETEEALLAAKSNDTRTDESTIEEDLAQATKLAKKTDPALFEKYLEYLTGRRTTSPQLWVAVELERNEATAASQEESVTASPHKFKYHIGTRIDKEFDGFGWFSGKVVGYRHGFYHVIYEDGDEEEFDDEISNFVSPFQDEVDDIASDSESSAFEMNDLELHSREESSDDDLSRRPLKKRRTSSKKGKASRKRGVSEKSVEDGIPPSHGLETKIASDQVAAYKEVALKEAAAAQKDSGPTGGSQQVGKEQVNTIIICNKVQRDKNHPADMPGLVDEQAGVRGRVDDLSSPQDGGNAEAGSKMRVVSHESSGQTNGGIKRRAEEDIQAPQGNTRRSLPAKPDEELQNIFRTSAKSFINVKNKKHLTKGPTSKIAGSSPDNQSASVSTGVSHAVPRKERQLHGLAKPANGRVMFSKIPPGSKGSSSKIEFLAEAPPQKKNRSYKPRSSTQKSMLFCPKYPPPRKTHRSASAKHVFDRSNNRHRDNVLVKRARESRHPVISETLTADASQTGIPKSPPQNEKRTHKAKVQRMTLKSICHTIESEEQKYER